MKTFFFKKTRLFFFLSISPRTQKEKNFLVTLFSSFVAIIFPHQTLLVFTIYDVTQSPILSPTKCLAGSIASLSLFLFSLSLLVLLASGR